MNLRKQLIALSIIEHGDWDKIYLAIVKKELPTEEESDIICSTIKSNVLTILDSDYPSYLKEYYHPPFVLFYYGDISLIKDYRRNLAVVGSRESPGDVIKYTRGIVEEVAKEVVIVSGLARGIDAIAHECAIKAGGKTIAILGCGIDMCYPAENEELYQIIKKDHLLISEYSGLETPDSYHFPYRNRLIVALSRATFIPHGHFQSGTQITSSFSTMFNHTIYCLPSSDIDNSLCDSLIQDGAFLVRNSGDILYEYNK